MGALAISLIGGLIAVLGPIVVQMLISAGIGVVTYSGISVALDFLSVWFMDSAKTLPAAVVGLLGVLKVGTSFKILVSALTMKMTMSGVQGTVSKFKVK